MAKNTQITTTQTQIENQVDGQLANNTPKQTFTNKFAIETVCKAIAVTTNPKATQAEKDLVGKVAAHVGLNSLGVTDEMRELAGQIGLEL